MIHLACDPGVHLSHLCILDLRRKCATFMEVASEAVFPAFSGISGLSPQSFTVECPQVYGSALSRKDDIVALALQAGVIKGTAMAIWADTPIHAPLPRQWKGQVPKPIHNDRMMAKAQRDGITVNFGKIPAGRHNHCIDALGLAFWASAQKLTSLEN